MSQSQVMLSQRAVCSSLDSRVSISASSSRQLRVPGGLSMKRRVTQKRSRSLHAEAEPVLRKPAAPKPERPAEAEDVGDESTAAQEEVKAPAPVGNDSSGVTLEFQRQQAKAMIAYFEDQDLEKVEKKTFFGWTPENEIGNGRWVMFGILVGFITEYATGVSFWDQLKLIVTYLGIADIYEY